VREKSLTHTHTHTSGNNLKTATSHVEKNSTKENKKAALFYRRFQDTANHGDPANRRV
jgi:hypothetical protein